MLVVGGATGHDGRGNPCHPGGGRGGSRGPATSDPERQRPGVRRGGGAVVAGGDRLRETARRAGESVAERLRRVVQRQVSRRVPGARGIRERTASEGVGRALEGGV